MLVKFEQIGIVRPTHNFEFFDKKSGFLKSFLTSVDTILEDVFIAESII